MKNVMKTFFAMCAVVLVSSGNISKADDHNLPPCPEYCQDFYDILSGAAWDAYQTRLAACGNDQFCRLDALMYYMQDMTAAEQFRADCCNLAS